MHKTVFTVGYGGRHPQEFLRLLRDAGVRTLVDVRLRPHRASMGSYVKAKTPGKGIEALLAEGAIKYVSLPKLGNKFLEFEDWRERYAAYLNEGGPAVLEPLSALDAPFCLMCAEKKYTECHREQLAQFLQRVWPSVVVVHL